MRPIPRDVLFGNPARLSPAVSPDGTRLFFLAPLDGVLNVWSAPIDHPGRATPVTRDAGRGIRTYGLGHDDRTLFYVIDDGGDEGWRLYLVDLGTGRTRCATPFPGIQARVLAHNRRHPATMLVGLNRRTRHLHDVYALDLADGTLTLIAENPGYLSWIIDHDLRVRGGVRPRPDGGTVIALDGDDTWLTVPDEDAMGTRIAGFAPSGDVCYLLSSIGADAVRLYEVSLPDNTHTLLAADPHHDVRMVEFDPVSQRPQAVVFAADRDERLILDETYGRELARIRTALAADAEIYVERTSRDDREWLVTAVAGDAPVRYHRYSPGTGELRLLFSHQPALDAYPMARMEPFVFTARDGVPVHGYVTWPVGVPRSGLPAVVNVHGGPWARNSFGFDEEAQLLASHGYACVQVNFRGSTGYGKRFRNLGAREWGAAMHTDLLDAIGHLTVTGGIDPDRVAIMGCSYGGYAALVGAAFTPSVFRCAIDLCGPSNLLTMMTGGAPYRTSLQAFMVAQVGDPDRDRDLLWSRSPLSRAADITIPVLVVQGANDVRVPVSEAEQIVAALARNGVPHEYLLFPDEGHGLVRPENRDTYYAAVERFLATHLGTAPAPAGDPAPSRPRLPEPARSSAGPAPGAGPESGRRRA
ncbi:S9 family peptidase [Actinoplanes sp. NPDC020271]|uniref:S9 family peptidase n=1 Tax=Actinoplanes sp. NPDC020271 TaxID=3363896 RepID=UPI0037BC80A1